MLIGAIIAVCIVLLILAFLAPRLSHGPERGAHQAFGLGSRAGSQGARPAGPPVLQAVSLRLEGRRPQRLGRPSRARQAAAVARGASGGHRRRYMFRGP